MLQNELIDFRRSQIDAFLASGLTAADWCQENQIKVSTLRYWLHKIRTSENINSQKNGWISLSPDNSKSVMTTPIAIKIGTLSIEVQAGFDKSSLVDVITAVKSLC